MYIYKTAVVGAGAMGAEIAQVISYSGLPVVLKEVSDELAQKALVNIRKVYQGRVDKGKMTPSEMDSKMALVTVTTRLGNKKEADKVQNHDMLEEEAAGEGAGAQGATAADDTALLFSKEPVLPIQRGKPGQLNRTNKYE